MNTTSQEVARVSAVHEFGLPGERFARLAARRAFVEMKACFLRATADIEGPQGAALHLQVRQADEAIELWLMRHDIFDALPVEQACGMAHRAELRRQIDSLFQDNDSDFRSM